MIVTFLSRPLSNFNASLPLTHSDRLLVTSLSSSSSVSRDVPARGKSCDISLEAASTSLWCRIVMWHIIVTSNSCGTTSDWTYPAFPWENLLLATQIVYNESEVYIGFMLLDLKVEVVLIWGISPLAPRAVTHCQVRFYLRPADKNLICGHAALHCIALHCIALLQGNLSDLFCFTWRNQLLCVSKLLLSAFTHFQENTRVRNGDDLSSLES